MLAADVNLLPVIATLRQQTSNEHLREILLNVQEDLEMGVPLAMAFARYPEEFSPFYIQLIRQGEIEGALPDVLQRLADHYESEARGDLVAGGPQVNVNIDMGTVVEALRPLTVGVLSSIALVAFAAAGVLYLTTVELLDPADLAPNLVLTVALCVLLSIAIVSRFRPRSVRRCSFCGKLDTEAGEVVQSRGVAICRACIAGMVKRMRRPEPVAAPVAAPDQATRTRIAEADGTAFRDPETPIDLSVGSGEDDAPWTQ
jgi:hypothetical protein